MPKDPGKEFDDYGKYWEAISETIDKIKEYAKKDLEEKMVRNFL